VSGRGTPAPIAIAAEYYVEAPLLCAWCELRADYRHFRADRIAAATVRDPGFAHRCRPTDGGMAGADRDALTDAP
jgi:predicted DNA-binding transcriptional regulator YafY